LPLPAQSAGCLRRDIDLGVVIRRQARGADDDMAAMGQRGQRMMLDRVGLGIIDQHVRRCFERLGNAGADDDAKRAKTRHLARITASGSARDGSDELQVRRCPDRRHQCLANPAGHPGQRDTDGHEYCSRFACR
jgi:hypothetical protein